MLLAFVFHFCIYYIKKSREKQDLFEKVMLYAVSHKDINCV